ncbi:hypothetical protein BDF21DRAFT_147327 [Thamnidium elegans]|nr:hypothetical protein BDF21DRAFT_147327 [Thamnidium elegans]
MTLLPKKEIFSSRIRLSQMGLMPNPFIGEHDRLVQLAQLHAQHNQFTTIGLGLGEQNVYERVHPDYLTKTLLQFGISNSIINIVTNFFFSTRLHTV